MTRYHHGSFTTYTTEHGLPHNWVREITGDASGHMWVLCEDSVAQWQESSGRFIDITPGNFKIAYDTFLWERGGFWRSDESRLYYFVNGRFVSYELPRWLPGRRICCVAMDQNDTIWLETIGGKQARIIRGKLQPEPLGTSMIYTDRSGNPWRIGIGRHLLRYMHWPPYGRTVKISFNSLQEDGEGNLWLASQGQGLYRVPRRFITVYSKEEGLVDRNVYRQSGITLGPCGSELGKKASAAFRMENYDLHR